MGGDGGVHGAARWRVGSRGSALLERTRKAFAVPWKASRTMWPAEEFVLRRMHFPSLEKVRLVQSWGWAWPAPCCVARRAICGAVVSSSARSKVMKGAWSKLRTSYKRIVLVAGLAMASTVAVGS